MEDNNDPWAGTSQYTDENTTLSFGSNFNKLEENQEKQSQQQHPASSKGVLHDDSYSQTLEAKLERLKQKGKMSYSGKEMLKNFKAQGDFYMNDLLQSDSLYSSNNSSSLDNPSFFENLYQTNSVYRHINPQQALESSEKLPIVHHDHLANQINDEDTKPSYQISSETLSTKQIEVATNTEEIVK